MKIAFYTIALRHGGAERCMAILANEFVKLGHSVIFIQNDEYQESSFSLDTSIAIASLGGLHFNNLASFLKPIARLRHILKDYKPDVILSFFPDTVFFASIAALGLNIPIIFSERNDPSMNLKGWKMSFFQRQAIDKSKWLVFQTEQVRQFYPQYLYKSSVVLNPCDTSSFPIEDCHKEKIIVSVGRLEPQKNQKLLIDAFALVSSKHIDYRLIIFGEGSLRSDLEKQIVQLNLQDRISLPGTIDDVVSHINNCSIFVLSSDYEGLPNALIEAMALGLPCISTDCSPGGARELIHNNRNGIIVPCRDPLSLSNAILYMIENPLIAEGMGREAKKIRNRTEPFMIAQEWLRLIDNLLQ
jgi:glycosyltransferase involved in cell wall biosynthesis